VKQDWISFPSLDFAAFQLRYPIMLVYIYVLISLNLRHTVTDQQKASPEYPETAIGDDAFDLSRKQEWHARPAWQIWGTIRSLIISGSSVS
jgi:hypothetical protein